MSEELEEKLDELEQEAAKEVVEEEIEVKAEEKPPGFLTHEEWIEQGKDPADFRGENAYKAHYDSLKDVRDLKSTMNQVVAGVESWKQQQNESKAQEIAEAKIQAVADLAKAKDADDMDGYATATDKIASLEKQSNIVQTTQVNPIITDFASQNPIIDRSNAQYDPEFHQDMIMIHNSKLDQLLGGDRSRAGELTPAQIERVQALAFTQAKELHPGKFVSSKNKRVTSASPSKKKVEGVDAVSQLRSIKGNSKNPRDTTPAQDIYKLLLEKDPAAAETFAKNITTGE